MAHLNWQINGSNLEKTHKTKSNPHLKNTNHHTFKTINSRIDYQLFSRQFALKSNLGYTQLQMNQSKFSNFLASKVNTPNKTKK